MKTVSTFLIFMAVVLIQLAIPFKMIYDQEDIILTGTPYKFLTEPVDPTDPFRGKYITLNYEIDHYKTTKNEWYYNEEVFIYLEKDIHGFAQIDTVSKFKLKRETDFIKSKVSFYDYNNVYFDFSFDKFYMEESKAYDAELAYLKVNRDSTKFNTYGVVYVKEGEALLNNVYIDDIPIAEYVDK